MLISTPRRFGKTISVSMFAAAMIFSAARVELSIYSTCKRISQKLLRNVRKFIDMIFLDLNIQPYKVIRENQVSAAPARFSVGRLVGSTKHMTTGRRRRFSCRDRKALRTSELSTATLAECRRLRGQEEI